VVTFPKLPRRLESVTLFFGSVGFYADESQEKEETGEGENNNQQDFLFAPYKSDSFDFFNGSFCFLETRAD
jgi:hypothetical protein